MKILVVDDDENNLLLIKLELRDELWGVITASNGREAIELFKAENPDLAIVDIRLPDVDGITPLKEMKTLRPEMQVAIFTGCDQSALTVPEEAGAFVIKSSSFKDLKEFVRRHARTD